MKNPLLFWFYRWIERLGELAEAFEPIEAKLARATAKNDQLQKELDEAREIIADSGFDLGEDDLRVSLAAAQADNRRIVDLLEDWQEYAKASATCFGRRDQAECRCLICRTREIFKTPIETGKCSGKSSI